MKPSLHELLFVDDHVVPQIIESELIVRHISDITVICGAALIVVHAVQHYAHGESEEFMYFTHPLGVTLCQIVVDRDDVDALAFQCVQICRQRRHKGLTFTGLHLGNTSLVQDDSSDQLNSVVSHAKRSRCALPHDRICLRQDVIQRLAVFQPLLELPCLSAQFLIAQSLHLWPERLDTVHDRIDPLQLILAVGSENLLYYTHIP